MQQAVPNINCPNLRCRAANPEGEPVCKVCGTSIPRRYLWVMGEHPMSYQAGDRLFDRYLFKSPQVVLDTQPGLPLSSAFDITDNVLPYLKLFPFRLHLPQLYCLLKIEPSADEPQALVLLEGAPLAITDFGDPAEHPLAHPPALLQRIAVANTFTDAWRTAPVLRQIHWLWQMVELWDPLQREGVAWSLVNPDLLRVEGPLLRLLSLEFNSRKAPSLAALGEFWAKWCLPYVGQWRTQFSGLCDRLVSEDLTTIEALSAEIESWLSAVRASSEVKIDIATRTDPGPSRDQNEDACYPHDGMVLQNSHDGILVVCDGVGGHEGGEVASGIAISVLTEHFKQTPLSQLSPDGVMTESEIAVGMANDLIVKRNDSENRHDRDRMGTTVVMALAQGHDLYLTNLGDSRAYLINAEGCYQLTTDDDIATREVRLGYLPYRDAVRQPGSGSLIQALGMVPSSMLRPAVQRFVVDSDCVFLLCSDGLSDFERVETLWQRHILPLLSGQVDLAQTTKTLIAEANRLNGHDNVTVGLLHYHVKPLSAAEQPTQLDPSQAWPSPLPPTQINPVKAAQSPSAKVSKQRSFWPVVMLGTLMGGAGFALGVLLWPKATPILPNPTVSVSSPTPFPEPTLDTKSYWTVRRTLGDRPVSSAAPYPTLDLKSSPNANAESLAILAHGVVFKIMGSQKNAEPNPTSWYQVKVCGQIHGQSPPIIHAPPSVSKAPSVLPKAIPSDQPGSRKSGFGYVPATVFQRVAVTVEPEQVGTLNVEGCTVAATPPSLLSSPPSSSPVPEKPTP
jgi:protein phosphatase